MQRHIHVTSPFDAHLPDTKQISGTDHVTTTTSSFGDEMYIPICGQSLRDAIVVSAREKSLLQRCRRQRVKFSGRGAVFRKQPRTLLHRGRCPRHKQSDARIETLSPFQSLALCSFTTGCRPTFVIVNDNTIQTLWTLSRRARNQKRHALNGNPSPSQKVQQWFAERLPLEEVRQKLKSGGYSLSRVSPLLRKYK